MQVDMNALIAVVCAVIATVSVQRVWNRFRLEAKVNKYLRLRQMLRAAEAAEDERCVNMILGHMDDLWVTMDKHQQEKINVYTRTEWRARIPPMTEKKS